MLFQFILLKISSSLFFKLLLKVLVSFYWIINQQNTKTYVSTKSWYPKSVETLFPVLLYAPRPPPDHPKTTPNRLLGPLEPLLDHPQTTQRPPQQRLLGALGPLLGRHTKIIKKSMPKMTGLDSQKPPKMTPKSHQKAIKNRCKKRCEKRTRIEPT